MLREVVALAPITVCKGPEGRLALNTNDEPQRDEIKTTSVLSGDNISQTSENWGKVIERKELVSDSLTGCH